MFSIFAHKSSFRTKALRFFYYLGTTHFEQDLYNFDQNLFKKFDQISRENLAH